jgi:hypothetical protein
VLGTQIRVQVDLVRAAAEYGEREGSMTLLDNWDSFLFRLFSVGCECNCVIIHVTIDLIC